MTAKRRPRGTLARLDALEDREAARVEAVKSDNLARLSAARSRLSAADRIAWEDSARVMDEDTEPDTVTRIDRACAHLPPSVPLGHAARVDADRWMDRVSAVLDAPGSAPLPALPAEQVAAFLAYYDACAAWCDAEAVRVPLSPDVHRLARWGAALWRFDRNLCAVLGGRP